MNIVFAVIIKKINPKFRYLLTTIYHKRPSTNY